MGLFRFSLIVKRYNIKWQVTRDGFFKGKKIKKFQSASLFEASLKLFANEVVANRMNQN